MKPIRVLLADDHAQFRKVVAELLAAHPDFELVGEAADGAEALEQARALVPEVILMDLSMPRMDGIEATRRIRAELPCVRIVVLTARDANGSVLEAVRSGAQGFVLKDIDPAALVRTLKAVACGRAPVSPAMAAQLLKGLAAESPTSASCWSGTGLTPREHEALRLTAQGKCPAAIASALGIAQDTVATVLQNVLEKLHLDQRLRLAASGLRPERPTRSGHA